MPKIEAKHVQKDLEAGVIWPVYWIHGQERMKSRELLKRIRLAVVGEENLGFAEETLDGNETTAARIIDAAQSLSLGGGVRLVVVRDAHAVKESEELAALFGPCAKKQDLTSVCVFLSKDLDGRKKFSKMLVESAAVVACEEVSEDEREAWIGYLARRRGVALQDPQVAQLRGLDPWSLDIIDQELEKFSLATPDDAAEVLLSGSGAGGEAFFEPFFRRELKPALEVAGRFAESPEEALPLLGLLAWNTRFLALVLADREHGTRTTRLSPFLADRFQRWSRHWKLQDALELQAALAELDFGIKQTPRLPLGLWSGLVTRFCR